MHISFVVFLILSLLIFLLNILVNNHSASDKVTGKNTFLMLETWSQS